jgi:hypothetical protein
MTEPKPDEKGPLDCPFCEPQGEEGPTYDHSNSAGVAIQCEDCGMRGPTLEGMDDALEAWNQIVQRYKLVV